MLAIVRRELVTAEGQYHRSCYRVYTKDPNTDIDKGEINLDQAECHYEAAERMALYKVFAYIMEGLIEHPTVVPFTDLTSKLVTEMAESGVTQVASSTKKYILRQKKNDTALCLQKQATSEDAIPLPQNIKPGLFTTLAWDNIERLEETISGEGTSHMNGIAVQTKPTAETRALPCIPKTKKGSIEAVEMVLPIYNARECANSSVIQTIDTNHASFLQNTIITFSYN